MNILAVDNNTGSRFYRLVPQLKHMAKQGHKVDMIAHNDPNFDARINWADVVIFQMVFSPETVADVKKLGKKVIFECDDLIHTVPKSHYSYKETKGLGRFKFLWQCWKVFRQCDGFISTSKYLNRVYGWMSGWSIEWPRK